MLVIPSPAIDLTTRKRDIESAHDTAISNLIECGRLLVDTQHHLKEQAFIAFCDDLKFSRSTAYNYMRLYQHSLVQQLDTLQHAMINLSVWYQLEPDSDVVQEVKRLADSGKKVTKELARKLVNESAPMNTALEQAADNAPDFVADAIMRGAVTDIDGNDIPLHEADNTLIRVSTDQFLYESAQRQRMHIGERSKPKGKLTVNLQLVRDETGRMRLALPEDVPAWLAGREITFYFEEEQAA